MIHLETFRVPLPGGTHRRKCTPGLDRNNRTEINCSTQQVGRNGLETSQDSYKALQGKPKECHGTPSSPERLSACVGCEVEDKHEPPREATEDTQLPQQRTDHIPQIWLVCLWNAEKIEWPANSSTISGTENISGIEQQKSFQAKLQNQMK